MVYDVNSDAFEARPIMTPLVPASGRGRIDATSLLIRMSDFIAHLRRGGCLGPVTHFTMRPVDDRSVDVMWFRMSRSSDGPIYSVEV